MLNRKQVRALLFSVLLICSVFGANVTLAAVESGGDATSETGAANDVAVPDGVINSTSDSNITIEYAAEQRYNTDHLYLTVDGPTGWQTYNLTASEGTVNYTIPEGSLPGGEHFYDARLTYEPPGSYERLAMDTGTIESLSPVVVNSTTVESGPYYPDRTISVDVELTNPSSSAENFTVGLYQSTHIGTTIHYNSNGNTAKTVEVEPNSNTTVELNASFGYTTQVGLLANTDPAADLTIQTPLEAANVSVNSTTAVVGESIKLTANVTNAHSPEGEYTVRPDKDGREAYENQNRSIYEAGETKELTFNISFASEGQHTLGVLGKTQTVNVVNPVNATSVTVADDTVYTETNTTLNVTVVNTGDQSGTFPVAATNQHGFMVGSTEVTLAAGESKQISFNITVGDMYTNEITVLNRSTSVSPVSPFSVVNASVSTNQTSIGETVSASFNISNDNAPTGDYNFQFSFGDNYVHKEVTLQKGATTEVSVSSAFNTPGERSISPRFTETALTVNVSSPVEIQNVTRVNETAYVQVPTTYNATVTNTGAAGTYTVALINDRGIVRGDTQVSLEAGQTKTVQVTGTLYSTGTQSVQVNDYEFTEQVESPLNITTTVTTSEPSIGENIDIEVQVVNEHAPEGSYGFWIRAYDTFEQNVNFELAEGESVNRTYTIPAYDLPGDKPLRVNGEQQDITVTNPLNVSAYEFNKTAPMVGEPVSVNFTVTNTGEAGTYPVALGHQYRRTTYATKDVEFAAGETKEVQLNTTFDSPKRHHLRLLNRTDVGLTVTNPVTVENYSLSDQQVYVNEEVTVTANVTNTGQAGTYQVPISKWGSVIASTNVTLDAGESREVSITFSPTNPIDKWDRVAIGDAALTDLIVEHRFTVQSVTVDDGVTPGEQVTIEANITNPTSETATQRIDRTLGPTNERKELTLAPGESQIITITGSYDQSGQYHHWIGSETVPIYVFESQSGAANITIPDQYFPTETTVGQELYVPVRVKNVGDGPGVRTLNLSVDGTQVDQDRVSSKPGEEEFAVFRTTFESPGEYTYSVGNTTRTITVQEQVILDTSVEHIGGTEPRTTPSVRTQFSSYGLSVSLTDDAQYRDLTRIGAATDSRFRVNVTLRDYDPNVLLNTGENTTWTTADLGDNRTRISINVSPADLQYRNDPPSLEEWTSTNDTADAATPAAVQMRIGNGEYSRYDVDGSVLEGMTISTNAQTFRQPKYVPGTNDTGPELQVKLAGPHYTVNDEIYDGYYTAFLPDSLLSAWNVSDPSQLTVDYSAADGSTEYTVEQTDGGLRITADIHYSSGTLSIAKNTAVNTPDQGDGTTGSEGEETTDPSNEDGTTDDTSGSEEPGNTDGSSDGAGGGGGQSQTDPAARTSITDTDAGVTAYVSDVPTGATVELDLPTDSSRQLSVSTLALDFTFDHSDRARVEVSSLSETPASAPPVSAGTALSYFSVETANLDQDSLDAATITFSVPESALPEGTSPDDVQLFHFTDGSWTALETTHVDGSQYRATTSGFSEFAIGTTADATTATTETPTETEAGTSSTATSEPTVTQTETPAAADPAGTTQTDSPGFGIVATLVTLLSMLVVRRRIMG